MWRLRIDRNLVLFGITELRWLPRKKRCNQHGVHGKIKFSNQSQNDMYAVACVAGYEFDNEIVSFIIIIIILS